MPELPEVETVKRTLEPLLINRTITDGALFRPKSVVGDAESFLPSLKGKKFLRLTRKGKFLIFALSDDLFLVSHLRMEGKFYVIPHEDPQGRHDILRLTLDDGFDLLFNDTRKFGILFLRTKETLMSTSPLLEVGKEPWDIMVNDLYTGLIRKKKGTIKEALLDQTIMSGLGNIYDDEVLFATHINPRRPACSITLKEAEDIKKESSRIMMEAIEEGGSTIRSYHPGLGVDGRMQSHLNAYGRAGEPCIHCGRPLRKISIGGRGTVYCSNCQPYSERPYVVSVTGPIASGKSTVSNYLVEQGYELLDADAIVNKLYDNPTIQKQVISLLNLSQDTPFSKAEVFQAVEGNKRQKTLLEGLIHPLVYKVIKDRIATKQGGKIVLDVPLLVGSPLEDETDFLIYIAATPDVERERIINRGLDPEKYLSLNKSYPRGLVKRKADLVLSGNGDKEALRKELLACKWIR